MKKRKQEGRTTDTFRNGFEGERLRYTQRFSFIERLLKTGDIRGGGEREREREEGRERGSERRRERETKRHEEKK